MITFQSLAATGKSLTNEMTVSGPPIGIIHYYDNFYWREKENAATNSLRYFGLLSIF